MRKIDTILQQQGIAFISGKIKESLKPFVLFDSALVEIKEPTWGFDWHAHSGVATLSFPYVGKVEHEDTTGSKRTIEAGGFQWMHTGNGILHKEVFTPDQGQVGFHQLWVRLPPEEEQKDASYFEAQKSQIPVVGTTRIFIGEYNGVQSPYKVPVDISFFDIHLQAGEVWEYQPSETQQRGLLYPRNGKLIIEGQEMQAYELGKFVDSTEKIKVKAIESSDFIIALAQIDTYPLVASYGQLHTNKEALILATQKIAALKKSKNL